jgi:putative SOS response-associated peptidase YedK
VKHDRAGNLPLLPGIFHDYLAPVVRVDKDGKRAIDMMRWGFPPPPKLGTQPVSNVRNAASSYWRPWLKPEFRCLAPATSFCEYTDSQPKVPRRVADAARKAHRGVWKDVIWTMVV